MNGQDVSWLQNHVQKKDDFLSEYGEDAAYKIELHVSGDGRYERQLWVWILDYLFW